MSLAYPYTMAMRWTQKDPTQKTIREAATARQADWMTGDGLSMSTDEFGYDSLLEFNTFT